MPDAHPILCSKCKKPGTADKAECASCHGRVVRVCGACGFKNSAAKKYCDACGENFSLVKAPPAAPKPEAKAPPPAPAPKPEPRPEPKPAPKPEPKPEPKPAPKPAPQVRLEDIKLPDVRPSDAPLELKPRKDTEPPRPRAEPAAPEKPKPPAPPPEKPKPPALPPEKPAEKPKEGRAAHDEALERYLPKTVISKIPRPDKPPVKRDDEPVPDMRPEEKPAPPAETPAEPKPEPAEPAPADGPPARKKEFLKMRLEGQTPPPEPLPPPPAKAEPKPAAKPEAKPEPKPAPKADKAPAEARKPGELDARLAKGFDAREKDRPAAAPPAKKAEGPSQTFIQRRPKAVFSTVLALFLLGTGGAVFFFKSRQKADPRDTLLKAAVEYLAALKQKEYDKAYALLSADSRRAAAPGAFRALQEEAFWSFDDLSGEIVAPGWAVVRYKVLSNQPVENDWVVMRFEEGRWTRAYWWPLMEGLEAALARGDHGAAARLAKEALAIDPLDPMPSAYYCEAAWLAGDAAAALESCSKALKQAETLPSRLGNDGIFRARHLIADVHRHTLKKTAEAADLYDQLLKYPRIEPAQACDLNLAKAEADLELGRQEPALAAFRQAAGVCRGEADAAFAAQGVSVLSGQGGADAVAAVQAHRMPGDEGTLAEWRAKSRAELAKRLKTRPADLPAEQWVPVHKAGPVYAVTLRTGASDVLTAEVDLFSRKIKVDMHVQ